MTWRERLALLLGAASPFAIQDPAAAHDLTGAGAEDSVGAMMGIQPLEFWQDPAHATQPVGGRSDLVGGSVEGFAVRL
jgi:hypothetical protein